MSAGRGDKLSFYDNLRNEIINISEAYEKRGRLSNSVTLEDRAEYIRYEFLQCGGMNDPEKSYRVTFSFDSREKAETFAEVIYLAAKEADLSSLMDMNVIKLSLSSGMLYIKDSDAISALLQIMGASHAMMELENIKILKNLRNNLNRKVNCEAGNIGKAVKAAGKRIDDINFLKERGAFDGLPEDLKEIGNLRIMYPEDSLSELGEKLKEKLGKSGVSHRLDKLSAEAEKIRKSEQKN